MQTIFFRHARPAKSVPIRTFRQQEYRRSMATKNTARAGPQPKRVLPRIKAAILRQVRHLQKLADLAELTFGRNAGQSSSRTIRPRSPRASPLSIGGCQSGSWKSSRRTKNWMVNSTKMHEKEESAVFQRSSFCGFWCFLRPILPLHFRIDSEMGATLCGAAESA